MKRPYRTTLLRTLCLTAITLFATSSYAQDDDDELPEFLPGLVAKYQWASGSADRVDADLLFDWNNSTDARLRGRQFEVVWTGYLYAKGNGPFQLSTYLAGKARIVLDGEVLLDTSAGIAKWIHSQPIDLSFGRKKIEIHYESLSKGNGRLGLYWKGPNFGLEPITPAYLSHAHDAGVKDHFLIGQSLNRGLRCAACHAKTGTQSSPVLDAPSLTHLQDNLRPSWLVPHLVAKAPANEELSNRRMPYFALDRNSAMAISAALFDASEKSVARKPIQPQLEAQAKKRKKKDPKVRTKADSQLGAETFVSAGCLACHQLDDLGSPLTLEQKLFGGGDVSQVAVKRTRAFLQRWLEDASSVNKNHRMPAMELSLNERLDLIEFLGGLGAENSRNDTKAAGDIQRGIGLIAKYRCGACHELPKSLVSELPKLESAPLGANSNWQNSCLQKAQPKENIPGFGLSTEQCEALKTFFETSTSNSEGPTGSQLLAENNCLACHSRDLEKGIATHLPQVATTYPATASRLAGLAPPSITGVGDKLQRTALIDAIRRSNAPLRDWLDVRMPKYEFTQAESETLASFLIGHDRIPEGLPDEGAVAHDLRDEEIKLAAARLVTSEGFGCQSCHQIGGFEPPKVDLKARGTNLMQLGNRIRESWFQRWVRNPSRIVPRMEMPAIQVAASGLLDDNLDLQLLALWKTLNDPNFVPPRPNAARVVRSHNRDEQYESAKLVTCVIETDSQKYLRPLAIGLKNRHNVLFDLESATLAGWWIGDTAGQYTRGKTWYWELGGDFLNHSDTANPLEQYSLVSADGARWNPIKKGLVATLLDEVQHDDLSIEWKGRISFASDQNPDTTRLIPITQRLTPSETGLLALTQLKVPEGFHLELTVCNPPSQEIACCSFEVSAASSGTISGIGDTITSSASGFIKIEEPNGVLSWTSTYESQLAKQSFPLRVVPKIAFKPAFLDCVPGYEAVQLPLPRDEMPISFAFGKRGEFFAGSLKGRILQLHDDDNDGLHDRFEVISDEYPTPYGLSVTEDEKLDALTKFALIRLTPPRNAEEQRAPWDVEIVADGWGYTADYHDWAVGLERDTEGNYLMALPCQQDDRTAAEAYLRGHAVKLVPTPKSESQRSYLLESFAAGLRFPMGIALSRRGDLFTSDNQGNYNPFNELNHLREGKRYGFINKLENKDGFAPDFEAPAINLPHPWTRSVNGICWLDTPETAKQTGETKLFGPFEGQLLGCEMNGRSLVRMSLQKVGDTYQGACYNFSLPELEPAETFEGPIVCEIAPNGDLYVGNLHDSGWGGGQNTGSIVRLRPSGDLPLGISEVQATPSGFRIDFTQQVSKRQAGDPANYQMRSYRRVSTPAYGGDDQDERTEDISAVEVSPDAKSVELTLASLREGCVYELNIMPIGEGSAELFPSQAHYSMRAIPVE